MASISIIEILLSPFATTPLAERPQERENSPTSQQPLPLVPDGTVGGLLVTGCTTSDQHYLNLVHQDHEIQFANLRLHKSYLVYREGTL